MPHPGGRPIEYTKEIVAKVQKYLKNCIDEPYTLVKTEGDKTTSWENHTKVNLPTIEGLAVYLGVARDTIYDWEKKYQEFSDILASLRAQQARELINKGLSGVYNPTIAKVLLTKHGYREGTDMTSDGKAIPAPIYGGKSDPDQV